MPSDVLIETHISRVLLRGDRVFKRPKPVCYPFADFSTLEKRRAACEAELSHNTPWAPGVYLRVLPVSGDPPVFGGPGEPTDYAVEMVRLPDEARLREHADTASHDTLERVGASLRAVHDNQSLRPGSASPEAVEARVRENLEELCAFELSISTARLRDAVNGALERARSALTARSAEGRSLHGDLRTEHIYLMDGKVLALDGVAFNEALAEGDPAEDIAFLAMELACVHARWDLEEALWRGWGADSTVTPELRDLYAGHRSLIRAKVHAIGGAKPERVHFHLLHALARLEPALEKPALVGVGGLPGVGKSTLAALLERFLGFGVVRSDVVRKQHDTTPSYTLEARNAVYQQLFELAAERLAKGERVLIDASFGREEWRAGLLEVARGAGVRGVLLFGHATEAVVEERLAKRVNDPSDADIQVHRLAREAWEASSDQTQRATHWVDTGQSPTVALNEAVAALSSVQLSPPVLAPEPPDPTQPHWSMQ